jgi:hypothetical protein
MARLLRTAAGPEPALRHRPQGDRALTRTGFALSDLRLGSTKLQCGYTALWRTDASDFLPFNVVVTNALGTAFLIVAAVLLCTRSSREAFSMAPSHRRLNAPVTAACGRIRARRRRGLRAPP